MDNTTAVAHVNNKGGTRSPQLVNLTLELWHDYLQRAILISGQHLPGKLYEVADRESRDFCDASEWQIDSQVIQPFIRKCNVDLVALCLTALLPTYAGWKPEPGATYTDAMTLDWVRLSPVQPTCSDAEEGISGQNRSGPSQSSLGGRALVASCSNLLVKNPFMILNSKHLLRDPASPLKIHPMYPRLPLAVFHISGISNKLKDFQKTLRN